MEHVVQAVQQGEGDIPECAPPHSVTTLSQLPDMIEQAEVRRDTLRAEAMVRLAIGCTMIALGRTTLHLVDEEVTKFAEKYRVDVTTQDGISTYSITARNAEGN